MVMPGMMFRRSMGGTGSSRIEWAWTESLAMARPGSTYRVVRIPVSLAREQCTRLGCAEGDCLTCTGNDGGTVILLRADGRRIVLQRVLAWYVQAELCPLGPSQ